jgi:hypothetical protein
MPSYASYKFGSPSAALLGVALTSNGKLTAFARTRVSATAATAGQPAPAMQDLYRSAPLNLGGAGTVDFTLTLSNLNADGSSKEGLLALAPMIWPRFYPGVIYYTLGAQDPLGAVDIDYASLGAVLRPAAIQANRAMGFSFQYDPNAADKAVLTVRDLQSNGMVAHRHVISALDNLPANYAGLVVAIQVDPANYSNGSATLQVTSGQSFNVRRSDNGAVVPNLSTLVLNTTASPV